MATYGNSPAVASTYPTYMGMAPAMLAQNPQQQSMMQQRPQNWDPYYMAAYGNRPPAAANTYPKSMAPAVNLPYGTAATTSYSGTPPIRTLTQ